MKVPTCCAWGAVVAGLLALSQPARAADEVWGCRYAVEAKAFLCAHWDDTNLRLAIDRVELDGRSRTVFSWGGEGSDEDPDEKSAAERVENEVAKASATQVDETCAGPKGCRLKRADVVITVRGNLGRTLVYTVAGQGLKEKGKIVKKKGETGSIEFNGAAYGRAARAVILSFLDVEVSDTRPPTPTRVYRVHRLREPRR